MIDPLCAHVIRELGISLFVETGTDMGETVAEASGWFSELDSDFGKITGYTVTGDRAYNPWNSTIRYPRFEGATESRYKVHSVDADETCYDNARALFESNPNIQLHHGDSVAFLKGFVDGRLGAESSQRCFFYLDAHWGKYWPLREEIEEILRLDRFAISVDDFMVPGKSKPAFPHADFGFDLYRGRALNWPYIQDLFGGRRVRVFYPTASNRDHRGWVLIVGGYSESELAFMDNPDYFELPQDDPVHCKKTATHPLAYLDYKILIKRVVPLPLLRSMIRAYQRATSRK